MPSLPSANLFRVKPFGNDNANGNVATKNTNHSTSFVSSAAQPSTPQSMQASSGFHSSYSPGLIRPM